uniref:Uncharacterized protein n=1 Tax=Oryza glaberrima TaxID=4538 RepID=I1R7N3_ORYGL
MTADLGRIEGVTAEVREERDKWRMSKKRENSSGCWKGGGVAMEVGVTVMVPMKKVAVSAAPLVALWMVDIWSWTQR